MPCFCESECCEHHPDALDCPNVTTDASTSFENEGRTWSPQPTAVERWVVWHPNVTSAVAFRTLNQAKVYRADTLDPSEYVISPVYA